MPRSRYPIDVRASKGLIRDLEPYALPPSEFSDISNMRWADGKFEKFVGMKTVADATPLGDPFALFLHTYQEANFWVYMDTVAAWAFTDTAEAEITRAAGAYTGGVFNRWNHCALNGLGYFNNGADDPQLWNAPGTGQVLLDVTNWPANYTCKVFRSFGKFLIALHTTESGTEFDSRVRWSHSAATGVPSSWDDTSATVDAGFIDLWDTPDTVMDCLPMGGVNIVYKENSTWLMRFVGGALKFAFQNVSRASGIMAQDCAVALPGNRHFVFTRDDCVVHDGTSFASAIDKTNRAYWFGNLDPGAPLISFVLHVASAGEVWVCAPFLGEGTVTRALIWNYIYDTWTIRDLPSVTGAAASLPVVTSAGDSWDSDITTTWAGETAEIWDDPKYLTSKEIIRFSSRTNTLIYELDKTLYQDSGVSYKSYVERSGLSIVGQKGQGSLTEGSLFPDPVRQKLLIAVWPRIEAVDGTTIDVYVTSQDHPESTITWSGPFTFTVGTDEKIDCKVRGRYLGVRFEETASTAWALHSFDMEIVPLGSR